MWTARGQNEQKLDFQTKTDRDMWTSENDSKRLRVDRYIFKQEKGKLLRSQAKTDPDGS